MSIKAAPMIFGGLILGLIAALFRSKSAHASETLQLPPPQPIRLEPTPITVDDPDEIDKETEQDIAEAVEDTSKSLPNSFTSVIPGVDDAKWTAYVKKQKQGRLNGITKSNSLGLFLMGYRMLQDLGYTRNSKKVTKTIDGVSRTVWEGEFIPPLTLDAFLSNAMLQYEAFAKMSASQSATIKQRYGSVISGSKGAITLSGLLNVAKVAGMGGLDAWLKEPAKRKADTTAEFNAFNGMF